MSILGRGARQPALPGHVVAVVALLLAVTPASATQHLISPGRNWESLDGRVRPGDQILLMPGVHKPARFEELRGKKDRPIIIRALDPTRETIIKAERVGLRFRQPQYVVVQDLTIVGATINGITITDEDRRGKTGAETSNVIVRDVVIRQIGPRGKRNGIQAIGVNDLTIERCTFDAWAGAGIDLQGCKNVQIRECSFTGRREFSQDCGVMIRAGSEKVRISKCRFEAAGEVVVRIGKKSNTEEFRPPLARELPPGSVFEAKNVEVRNCFILEPIIAFSIANATGTVLRSNSIIGTRECLIEVIADHEDDARFGKAGPLRLGNNLIVWKNSDLLQLVDLQNDIKTLDVQLDQNLWWSEEPLERRQRIVDTVPGKSIYPQVVDIDPLLDASQSPTTRGTELFGLKAP